MALGTGWSLCWSTGLILRQGDALGLPGLVIFQAEPQSWPHGLTPWAAQPFMVGLLNRCASKFFLMFSNFWKKSCWVWLYSLTRCAELKLSALKKPIRCESCGFECSSKLYLNIHIKSFHEKRGFLNVNFVVTKNDMKLLFKCTSKRELKGLFLLFMKKKNPIQMETM